MEIHEDVYATDDEDVENVENVEMIRKLNNWFRMQRMATEVMGSVIKGSIIWYQDMNRWTKTLHAKPPRQISLMN